MKNKAVKLSLIATVLPHVFCCGLPIALSLVGLVAPDVAHFHIIPHWMEPWVFVASGAMLAVSWLMILRDCGCACDHCHGGHSHRTQKIILAVITAVFVFSVILHLFVH